MLSLTSIPEKENNGSKRLSPTPSVSNLSLRSCRYRSTVTRSSERVYLFVEGRGSRVPCRGRGYQVECEGNIFFSKFFFLKKVIIDAINVIKTNKKNLKNKWRVNISSCSVEGEGRFWGGGGWNREKLRDIPLCFRTEQNRTRYLKTLILKKML